VVRDSVFHLFQPLRVRPLFRAGPSHSLGLSLRSRPFILGAVSHPRFFFVLLGRPPLIMSLVDLLSFQGCSLSFGRTPSPLVTIPTLRQGRELTVPLQVLGQPFKTSEETKLAFALMRGFFATWSHPFESYRSSSRARTSACSRVRPRSGLRFALFPCVVTLPIQFSDVSSFSDAMLPLSSF